MKIKPVWLRTVDGVLNAEAIQRLSTTFTANGKREIRVYVFARDVGEKCGNKQNHSVKIDSLFTLKTLLQIFF